MNFELAAIMLGTDEIAEYYGKSVVGDVWPAVRSALKILPYTAPRSIRIRRTTAGFLIFYGVANDIWDFLPSKTAPAVTFEYGTMKKFTWMSGVGVQIELSAPYVEMGYTSHDWEIK